MAHRGERVISRKAIAQGMSDVLRFTCMLMRALFVHVAHEIAGAARIRHSLRPLIFEGAETSCKPRAQCVARTRTHIRCRPGLELRCAIARRGTHTPRPELFG